MNTATQGTSQMSSDSIRKKISALLQKNSENGATEEEATSAMKIAAKLMTEHGITMEDIQNNTDAASDFDYNYINSGRKNLHEVDSYGILKSIANFTDTHVHITRHLNKNSDIVFFGYQSDIQLAEYLREVCKRAMDTEWEKFSSENKLVGHKRKHRKNFMAGMSIRVSQRLRDMKNQHVEETSGNQLVVVKNQLVTSAFMKQNIKLKKKYNKTTITNGDSYNAGKKAGDNVHLNKSVTNNISTGSKLITG